MVFSSNSASAIFIFHIPNFQLIYKYVLTSTCYGYRLFPMKIDNGSYHSYLIVFYTSMWIILLDGNEIASGTLATRIARAVVDAYWKVLSYPNYTLYLTFYFQDVKVFSLEL